VNLNQIPKKIAIKGLFDLA